MIWEAAAAGCGIIAAGWGFARASGLRRRAARAEEALRKVMAGLDAERRAAEALRADFAAVLETCGVGVLFVDRGGVILRANDAARRLLAPPAPEIVGRRLIQATFSEELEALCRTAWETHAQQEREIRPAAGSSATLFVTATPLLESDSAEARCALIARDVTELRRLETIRRDFVANVSHELRTPLTSIRAMAETLQDGALEDRAVAARFLGTIVNETERLTRVAEDLLVLSDAESRVSEKRAVALSKMVEEIAAQFRPLAEKASIRLTHGIRPGIEVEANGDQMEQVVLNLIDNAIKYTGSGGSVHVSVEARDGSALLKVSDTGIGIMSQDLPRIFERFYRVDRARSRQSGGTGLGLSIVKHIVESHGGAVTVESEYNRGSAFSVRLPLTAGHAPIRDSASER
jgi:two-component system phosphate regulon sensor histidine kinase PhoR